MILTIIKLLLALSPLFLPVPEPATVEHCVDVHLSGQVYRVCGEIEATREAP